MGTKENIAKGTTGARELRQPCHLCLPPQSHHGTFWYLLMWPQCQGPEELSSNLSSQFTL